MHLTNISLCISVNSSDGCCTWDVDSVIFDVHLMQASLSGRILDSNSAVLVVCDVRLGHLARWHSDVTFSRGQKQTVW